MESDMLFEEHIVYGNVLPEAYHNALKTLYRFGSFTECGDWNCKQLECSITMVVKNPLDEPMISKFFIGGTRELQQYVMEMLDGILDFEIEKGSWKYTYHDRIKDQIPFVIEELKRSPSSRRAVITVRTEEDMGSEDPACMQHLQYFIRDNKLHCKVVFRSNDACKATFMNAFALIMLQKRIADELKISVGTYVHRANSFHCYEKDFDMLDKFIDRIYNTEKLHAPAENEEYELAYDYVGDWKEQMEDEIPSIMKQVEELKNR